MGDNCIWTNDDGVWDTGCGRYFEFNEGGPDENGFEFCPYCGKKLDALPAEEEEEDLAP